MARVHGLKNQVLEWATNLRETDYSHISGVEAQKKFDLPPQNSPPTHISDVDLPIGTTIEASKPISGQARQYRLKEVEEKWFKNPRNLG